MCFFNDWCPMSCGSCSSGWSRLRRHDRKAAGGWRRRVNDRVTLAAIVYVATTGCAWRQLPPAFGAFRQTINRHFAEWSRARVWARLYRIMLDELGARGELDWSRCAIDSVSMRTFRGGT